MRSWEVDKLDLKPRLPEILSSNDEGRALALDLAAGESLRDHEVHERAWIVVIEGEIEVSTAAGERARGSAGLMVELAPREDPIHETREPWRAVEVLGVRRQHDLAAALPAFEAEWTGTHRLDAEPCRVALGDVARHDLGLAYGEDTHERYAGFGE